MFEPRFNFEDFATESVDFEIKKTKKFDRIWRITYGGSINTTPIIHKEVLYFGSCDTYLYALNVNTGKELWRFKTNGCISCNSPPYFNGRLYFGSYDCHLYAISAETGKEIWRFATSTLVKSTYPPFEEGFETEIKISKTTGEIEDEKKYGESSISTDIDRDAYKVKSEYATKSKYTKESKYK